MITASVDSLLYSARKAERDGNKSKAEEFYKRIIIDYPESQDALSAKFDLLEINPKAMLEIEKTTSDEAFLLLSDEEKINAIRERTATELQKRNSSDYEDYNKSIKLQTGAYKSDDYWPYMVGVFVIAGLFVLPLIYSQIFSLFDITKVRLVFGSLMACGLFAYVTRDGPSSFWRILQAIIMLLVGVFASARVAEISSGRGEDTVFIGIVMIILFLLSIPIMAVCGRIGVIISKQTWISNIFKQTGITNLLKQTGITNLLKQTTHNAPKRNSTIHCKKCGGSIKLNSKVCKHCQAKFPYLTEPARTHVELISAYHSKGYSPMTIADTLNQKGIAPALKKTYWETEDIAQILKNHIV